MVRVVRELVLRTEQTWLRPVWRGFYEAVVRLVVWWLRRSSVDASVYVRRTVGFGDPVYGLSDIDLTVVLPSEDGTAGRARERLRSRWRGLCRMIPPLWDLVELAAYEEPDLRRAFAGSPSLTNRGSLHFGDRPLVDDNGMRVRPGLYGPGADWRRVVGPDRRPSLPAPDADERRLAVWLEVQYWWRNMFAVCVEPNRRDAAHICLKAVAETARAWLWLERGVEVATRSEALRLARLYMPDESAGLLRAQELRDALSRSPSPPLDTTLATLHQLSCLISARLDRDAESAGATSVRLLWNGRVQRAIPAEAGAQLRSLTGAGRSPMPLSDWRALVCPPSPDEVLMTLEGDPRTPAAVAAAASLSGAGLYVGLSRDGLLMLPVADQRRTHFRAVQSAVTDPVSAALLNGELVARFPHLPGWSAEDTARRAIEEHRGWLRTAQTDSMRSAQDLGLLLTAARAGLFWQSLRAGQPELHPTVDGAAAVLGLAEAADEYRASRSALRAPRRDVVDELARKVEGLPAYAAP